MGGREGGRERGKGERKKREKERRERKEKGKRRRGSVKVSGGWRVNQTTDIVAYSCKHGVYPDIQEISSRRKV